jgi:hypothetical protein
MSRIATVYGPDAEESDFESLKGKCFADIVQTGSGAHPTSYEIGTGGCFSGVKWPEREDDRLPPTTTEVKKI